MSEPTSYFSTAEEVGENTTESVMSRVEAISEINNPEALRAEILSIVMEGIEFAYEAGCRDTYENMDKIKEE